MGYAKSMIFQTLFGLLEDKNCAEICLTSHIFSAGFLSLMFEPDFSSIVVRSLSNCLSQIAVIPDSVPLFLLSVFESCSIHSDDEHLAEIARELCHAIVEALSHKSALSPYFDQVLDPALAFLQKQPTAEMLGSILTIFMLVNEGQLKHELTQKRFSMLLSIVSAVEGEEPSDSTFLKFQNIMNASTSLSLNLMFLIKVPEFIPLVMVAFSRSKRLAEVLRFFMELCKYSRSNVFSLHKGEVDLLLLRAFQGKFEYHGRSVEFNFGDDPPFFIREHVLPLISSILAVQSSYEVDRTLCDLITPSAEGLFSPNGPLAIETINFVFSILKSNPSPQFPIVSPRPMISLHSVDSSGIRAGLCLHSIPESIPSRCERCRIVLFFWR
jgi:hypothetical protein